MNRTTYIANAVTNAGGPVAAARSTGAKNYQTVQQWIRAGNVPAKYALAMERASGVSRRLLCKQWEAVWPELIRQLHEMDPVGEGGIEMEGPHHA
ncbi:YdaS family helix-turn-helix protein [Achromobacter spanius]|uniref:YdaS family helix-turn-helix protein n=1 Tax=Achromobacter spanius TaxID=217203 RepID=UPI003D33001B